MAKKIQKRPKIVRSSSIDKTIQQGKDYVSRSNRISRTRARLTKSNKVAKQQTKKQRKIAKNTTKPKRAARGTNRKPKLTAATLVPEPVPASSLFSPAPISGLFGSARTHLIPGTNPSIFLNVPRSPLFGTGTGGLFGAPATTAPVAAVARTGSRLSRSGSQNIARTGSKNNQIVIEQELQDRLDKNKAKIGKLNFSLRWWDPNDLDLHVVCPCGTQICFRNKKCLICGGELDIDMNAFINMSLQPVEHVYFNNPKPGLYKFYVEYYSGPKIFSNVTGGVSSKYALSLHQDLNQIFRYEDTVSQKQKQIHYDFNR